MADRIPFTEAQQTLIEATSSLYVDACPGAGKTQAIVQRYVERPVRHPRKGIALISFTNAAADEARRRAVIEPDLLRVPNFVGTIDSFINRFLVAPSMLARQGVSPTFRDKWSSLPNTTVNANVPLNPSLDDFIIDGQTALLDIERLQWPDRKIAISLKPNQRSRLERLALARWSNLVAAGTLTATASRTVLRTYLDDPLLKSSLAQILADRFSEVIVDEIQDCCEEDILVLGLLRDAGIGLVVVGDLDQAIYGFRTTTATHLSELLATLPNGDRLNGNFRSSPAICSIVDSLRTTDDSDEAVGRHRTLRSPVHLLKFDRTVELPEVLATVCSENDLEVDDLIVLAHATNTARVAAGASGDYKVGNGKLASLAAAFHVVSDESRSGTARSQALTSVGRYLRELSDHGDLTHDAYLEMIGLSEREFREECLRLAMLASDPYTAPPSVLRAALSAAQPSQRRLGWSPTSLRTPRGDAWPGKPKVSDAKLQHSTVHGFKGLQQPGVALVIPESTRADADHGVGQWTSGSSGEARRVLYVGASRAEKLLIVAAHKSVYDEVLSNLERDAVPVSQV